MLMPLAIAVVIGLACFALGTILEHVARRRFDAAAIEPEPEAPRPVEPKPKTVNILFTPQFYRGVEIGYGLGREDALKQSTN